MVGTSANADVISVLNIIKEKIDGISANKIMDMFNYLDIYGGRVLKSEDTTLSSGASVEWTIDPNANLKIIREIELFAEGEALLEVMQNKSIIYSNPIFQGKSLKDFLQGAKFPKESKITFKLTDLSTASNRCCINMSYYEINPIDFNNYLKK